MKLSKIEIAKLLESGISKDPLMLHGTSIEAIQKLFEIGTLPSGRQSEETTKNFLYFSPVQKKFKGTKFYKKITGFTVGHAKKTAKIYAKELASEWYITYEILKVVSNPIYAEKIMQNWLYDPLCHVPEDEMQKTLKLDNDKICSDAKKRKGVVLEVNEEILNLKIIMDPTLEARVYCPKGLDAKYIRGIKPLGKLEKDVIKKYL